MLEKNVILLAQQGNEECIEKIIKIYYPLIYFYNKGFFLQGGDKDDLIQEGIIGLLKAIKIYDFKKNVKFNTFAILCIKRNVITAAKKYGSVKNSVLNSVVTENYSLNGNSYDNLFILNKNPEIKLLEKEFNNNLIEILNINLTNFEKTICNYLFLGYGYIEIAKMLNKDIKKIDNGIQRIRNKTRLILEKLNNSLDKVI